MGVLFLVFIGQGIMEKTIVFTYDNYHPELKLERKKVMLLDECEFPRIAWVQKIKMHNINTSIKLAFTNLS